MRIVRPFRQLVPLWAAAAALLAAPGWAQTAATPAPAAASSALASSTPAWNAAQWQALRNAAQHTAGTTAFDYKWLFFSDIGRARVARIAGLRNATVRSAANLIAVPPAIREALLNLYTPGEKSQPIPYNNQGTAGFVVVELVRSSRALPLPSGAEFERSAAAWVSAGLLPPPEALLADAKERARAAYWTAMTPQAVQAIAAELSPNVEFGNYLTPLTRAILANRQDLAQALIDRGANPNACGALGCPVHLAVSAPDAQDGAKWLAWLLNRGAKPDTIDRRHQASAETALAAAIAQDRLAIAEDLVSAGASVDGVPGAQHTPLFQAATFHRRATVEWLITRGASVLPWSDRDFPPPAGVAHLFSAAQSTGDTEFAAWADATMMAAVNVSPRYRFEAFIEQDGKRQALQDGAALKLRAAPFRIVLALPPTASDAVTFGASFQKAWADEVRKGDLRNPMFRPFSAAALSEPPSEGSYDLLVGQACAEDAKENEACPGTQFVLQRDSSARKDFHSTRADKHEYLRDVRRIFDVASDRDIAVPLEQFRGKTLHMVLSTALNMGGPDGQRLIHPRFVTLTLQ